MGVFLANKVIAKSTQTLIHALPEQKIMRSEALKLEPVIFASRPSTSHICFMLILEEQNVTCPNQEAAACETHRTPNSDKFQLVLNKKTGAYFVDAYLRPRTDCGGSCSRGAASGANTADSTEAGTTMSSNERLRARCGSRGLKKWKLVPTSAGGAGSTPR